MPSTKARKSTSSTRKRKLSEAKQRVSNTLAIPRTPTEKKQTAKIEEAIAANPMASQPISAITDATWDDLLKVLPAPYALQAVPLTPAADQPSAKSLYLMHVCTPCFADLLEFMTKLSKATVLTETHFTKALRSLPPQSRVCAWLRALVDYLQVAVQEAVAADPSTKLTLHQLLKSKMAEIGCEAVSPSTLSEKHRMLKVLFTLARRSSGKKEKGGGIDPFTMGVIVGSINPTPTMIIVFLVLFLIYLLLLIMKTQKLFTHTRLQHVYKYI